MAGTNLAFCAAGGNRHASAADWAPGLLAYGAGRNLALWNPEDLAHKGLTALLAGHKDTINAVKIFDGRRGRQIITGAADNTIRLWEESQKGLKFTETQCLEDHKASVNVIALFAARQLFASGSADGKILVWDGSGAEARLSQTITLKPRYLPLSCALFDLTDRGTILAVAGTASFVQLYFRANDEANFELQATLTGHEGWIRCLDFVCNTDGDILLASASQDKYIRLWRIQAKSSESQANGLNADKAATSPLVTLSNKSHRIGSPSNKHNVTFEALLVGHEDWIYTARWAPSTSGDSTPTLLSASADNSLSIWRPDELSNIWVCDTRLGEISAQKGSTTATGSTGGFWVGLWQPDGLGVVSLGRTGSWRRWQYDNASDMWLQKVSIGGHTQEVQGCAWAPDGSYLLSTSSDQTTRMFAEWNRNGDCSWHEFARPQIHGYDLNCVASISHNQFVSGADEKLLRVFNKPKTIDQLLARLSGTTESVNGHLSESANIPVLGLSNKAISANDTQTLENGDDGELSAQEPTDAGRNPVPKLNHPPLEEHLARLTLWPEYEKLYGHGYEISAVAASNDGTLIATACKASTIDHAVIRLYDCQEWREMKPALTAHSLTVTSLTFSPDDQHLLSVSRDRGWAVFRQNQGEPKSFSMLCSNPKGHSRMILDCSWAPQDLGHAFTTAARDKAVKLWRLVGDKVELVQTLSVDATVTAVAFANRTSQGVAYLAYGTEDGRVSVVSIGQQDLSVQSTLNIDASTAPSGAVNALRWRPQHQSSPESDGKESLFQLAAASDDTSLRIYNILPT
jgi:elongator complex protein 2